MVSQRISSEYMEFSYCDLDVVWHMSLNMIATLQLRKADLQWLSKTVYQQYLLYISHIFSHDIISALWKITVLQIKHYKWLCSKMERSISRNACTKLHSLLQIHLYFTCHLNSFHARLLHRKATYNSRILTIYQICCFWYMSLSSYSPLTKKRPFFCLLGLMWFGQGKKILAENKGRDRLTEKQAGGQGVSFKLHDLQMPLSRLLCFSNS